MYKFTDLKDRIESSLREKLQANPIKDENDFSLIDGFINIPLHSEISGNIVMGGPIIPTIAIVGNNSGRIYTFALKALLPDIEL